jgi:hypothetical protein
MTLAKFCGSLALAATILVAFAGTGHSAKKYAEIAVDNGGNITGKVTFEGALPDGAIENILITKNPDVCGTGEREVIWVDVKDGALRGSFVFIDKIKEGKAWAEPEGGVHMINQKGCRFRPWAQVIKPGPLTIRNSDQGVLHNINTREMIGVEKGRVAMRTIFNFGQPDPGDIVQELKPRRSPFIAINCEAHNFMFGFLMAPKHPYAVVVGEDGSYSLDDVPPGEYTVKAWHPKFGLQESQVTVEAGGAAEASFAFSQE